MSSSRRFRLSMFVALYFVQGVALAYFRNFQKPYLNGLGIGADAIGLLTSILLLPFILKILVGLLSDRVNLLGYGHRKPYMLLGVLLAAASFAAAGFVLPDRSFLLFSAFLVAGSFSVSLFDSATDGMAVETTPREEQGSVQAAMVGGRSLGFVALSVVFGVLAQAHGFRVVFLIIAASMLLPVAWVVQVREPSQRRAAQAFQWRAFGGVVRPRFLVFAGYALVYSVASSGVDGLVTFFMSHDFGARETTIGTYGACRGVGAILGALGGGLLLDRVGRRQSAFGALLLVSAVAIGIGAAPGVTTLLMLGLLWGMAWGFQETVFLSLALDLADTRVAASMFAITMAVSNVGTAIGEGVGTALTDDIGFRAVFWGLASLNVVAFLILLGLFRVAPDIVRPRQCGARTDAR